MVKYIKKNPGLLDARARPQSSTTAKEMAIRNLLASLCVFCPKLNHHAISQLTVERTTFLL
jgi:hypothetical protein